MLAIILHISAPRADSHYPERALDVFDVPVSYTGKFKVLYNDSVYIGDVWHQRGRERRDIDTKVGRGSVVLRPDRDAAYFIGAGRKWCVSFGFNAGLALAGGIDGLMVSRKRLGPETQAGYPTVKYALEGRAANGLTFKGALWIATSGVPIRVAGVQIEASGAEHPVELLQTDIVTGALKPDLFDIPSGIMTFDLKSVRPDQLVAAIQSLGPLLKGYQ